MDPRILRITRVVADLDRAAAFYRNSLGFSIVSMGHFEIETFGSGEEIQLRLGAEHVALARFATPGKAYPPDSRTDDLWFQHLAIVVADMDAAYAHLAEHPGWRPISEGGPQTLPPANGSVRAFKFRDPDGHPLELIWFPPGQGRPVWYERHFDGPFLGIDHSALAVASTERSVAFYGALGLWVANRSLNEGPAQVRLDGMPGARVMVTGLRPASNDGMGLELLAYEPPGRPAASAPNDRATDWVTLAVPGAGGAVVDPDGHRLVLVDQGIGLPA